MFDLCLNENLKLYKKKSNVIFVIIILLSLFVSAGVVYCIRNNNIKNEEVAKENNSARFTLYNANASLDSLKLNNNSDTSSIFNTSNLSQSLNSLKATSEYYQYAVDNNIILDNADQNNYYKYYVLQELIILKTDLYDLKEKNNSDIKKINELNGNISDLTKILEKDDFNKYIENKILKIEEKFENKEISKEEKELSIYIEELKKKYEVGKFNNIYTSWKSKSIENIKSAKEALQSDYAILSADENKKLNDTIILETYRLELNIPVNDGMKSVVNYNDAYINLVETISIPLLFLFIIINAGSIISSEFSKGTIKQILMTPNKRWKILLSKMLVSILNLIIFTIILSIVGQLVGDIFFSEYSKSKYIYILNGNINSIDSIQYIILKFLSHDVEILVYMFFAIMLSTVTRNTASSVGTSIFIYAVNLNFMNVINKTISSEWIKFIPFNNLNIPDKIFTNSNSIISNIFSYKDNIIVNNITLKFSICVILMCSFLLIITTFNSFNNKEIT